MSFPRTDSEGRVYTVTNSAPVPGDVSIAGRRYNALGALYIDVAQPVAGHVGGIPFDQFNSVACAVGSLPPYAYNGGWPIDAAGKLSILVDQVPAATDPYVAGVRIAANGGLHTVTVGPP